MFYLTEDLVSSIKLKGFVPTGQNTFVDPDDFILLANEELQLKLVPHIIKTRQDFFVKHQITALVNGVNHYGVPERAIANSLVDLFYLPSSSDLTNKRPIAKVNLHDQQLWMSSSYQEVNKFFMEGDEVITIPTPSNPTGNLLFYYLRKPSKLVSTTDCAKITAVSSSAGTTTFTVDTDQSAEWTTSTLIDFVAAKSPFLCRYIDVTVTAITATTIAVATADVSDESSTVIPRVGSYICEAQETNIPQVPDLFHPILAKMVACQMFLSLGHMDKLAAHKAELVEDLKDAWAVIQNRIESEVDVLFDQNSLLNMVNSWSAWPYSTVR